MKEEWQGVFSRQYFPKQPVCGLQNASGGESHQARGREGNKRAERQRAGGRKAGREERERERKRKKEIGGKKERVEEHLVSP